MATGDDGRICKYWTDALFLVQAGEPKGEQSYARFEDFTAIGDEGSDPMTIAGLSMAAEAKLENDPAEISKATSLLYIKYPEHGPFRAFEHNETLIYRVTPKVISVIDYIKGFGHTELVIVDASD